MEQLVERFSLASSEVLSRLSPAEQSFRTNVLHVADFTEDVGATIVSGLHGDPISNGLAIGLDYQEFPDLGSLLDFSTFPDALRPTADAATILTQDERPDHRPALPAHRQRQPRSRGLLVHPLGVHPDGRGGSGQQGHPSLAEPWISWCPDCEEVRV